MKSNAALKYLAIASLAEVMGSDPVGYENDYEPRKRVSNNSRMSPSELKAKKNRRQKNKSARKQRRK